MSRVKRMLSCATVFLVTMILGVGMLGTAIEIVDQDYDYIEINPFKYDCPDDRIRPPK